MPINRLRRTPWRYWRSLALLGLSLIVTAPAVLARTASTSSDPLVVRTSTTWGYSLLLPASWQFRNASYPSDHSTLIWSDPIDPSQKVEIVFSGCYGCSHNPTTGAPQPAVGGNLRVTATYSISPTRLAYAAVSANDPYPDNGLVIVTKDGYTQINCWLPQSAHHMATLILNSYQAVPTSTRTSQTPASIQGQGQPPGNHGGGSVAAATVASGIGGVFILLIVLAILLYFLPSIIALLRQHHQKGAVFAINLLLGWTLIGWAVSLAMAMSAKRQSPVVVNQIVGGGAAANAPAVLPVGPPATAPATWPAGWYPDPQVPGQTRRWDGAAWTNEVRPA